MIYIKMLILFVIWILMSIMTGCALMPAINKIVRPGLRRTAGDTKECGGQTPAEGFSLRLVMAAGGLGTILLGLIMCGICALIGHLR